MLKRRLSAAMVAATLLPLLVVTPGPAGAALPPGHVDVVTFGDPASEAAHGLAAEFTSVVDGALGQKARVANPTNPPSIKGGELRFTMRVDPFAQNYFTVKFWGSDASSYKTIAYINGEQIGYRRNGDYEAINTGVGRALVNRFYYNTIMLPLEHTQGQRAVEIILRTYHGGFSGNVTDNSRGYYRAYTHTSAYLDVSGEPQGSLTPNTTPAPGPTEAEKQAMVDAYTAGQIALFNTYTSRVDASPAAKLSIVRYQDELRFYAHALLADWVPANNSALKRAALQRIFRVIDNHVKDYYANTRLVLRGGHQGDWGGYYGALGEALYIVENLIQDEAILGDAAFEALLREPFVTNTQDGPTSLAGVDWNGGPLDRGEAWERVLKANFDFARSRLSYITNQVFYTYEGAWEAHEGLRLIGSRFYEGRARSHRILLESLGSVPWLGEEVLVSPDGRELDVYHSLFWHDGSARFTDDYVQVIGKGLAKSKLDASGNVVRRRPYGNHYTNMTEAGLNRENTYAGNYNDTLNYAPEYVYKTFGHVGDEALHDEILRLALRSLHARGFARYMDVDGNGHRIMRLHQVVDERGATHPGQPSYATRTDFGVQMLWASLEKHMADNRDRFSGPEWAPYWQYAAEAVGFVQQQIADNQYFNTWTSVTGKNKYDLWLASTYAYVKQRPAGEVFPHTDFAYYTPAELAALNVNPADYERFTWVDIDNMFVSMRDGNTRIFGSLFERQRGVNANGRLHVQNGTHDNIVQIATNNQFQYQDYYLRINNIDVDFMEDQQTGDGTLPQALAGEIAPVAYQPGVGTVVRDGLEVDTPYAGYTDFLTARYGTYLFAFNTTRDEYGNKRAFELDVPSRAIDLVSGRSFGPGKVSVPPKTAMVLKLDSAAERAVEPHHVDFVQALRGNDHAVLTWKATAGAESYTVKRDGRVIASHVRGASYVDKDAKENKTYSYTVTAVNRHGSGWESQATQLPAVHPQDGPWREDRIGAVSTGRINSNKHRIEMSGGNGSGLGNGNDHILYQRDTLKDSLLFAHQVLVGSGSVSAKIDSHSGPLSGVMLRADLSESTRYIYFGADAAGKLVLQNRNRDSFHDWQDVPRSPFNAGVQGYTAAEYPYVKLVRDYDSHFVRAWASKDGRAWTFVAELFSPFTKAVHAGVAATTTARFTDVKLERHDQGTLYARVERVRDQVTLHWSKPNTAVRFNVYRTGDLHSGAWEKALSNALTFSYRDEPLRFGTRYYKVTAVGVDGVERPGSGILMATAEPIATVIAEAEKIPAADYTKGSFYGLANAIAEAKESIKTPGYDEAALINSVYGAVAVLVPVTTLFRKVPIEPSMVEASTLPWPGTGGTRQENGWRAFDGDLTTAPDTLEAVSWIDVKLPNPVSLDGFRYYPRPGQIARANGTIFQGSNDNGATWTNLHAIIGVNAAQWYEVKVPRTAAYSWLRIYDDHNGRANLAEVEFMRLTNDTTLLAVLVDEANAIDQSRYTAESVAVMVAAVEHAQSVLANAGATQTDIDAASDRLLNAITSLEERS